MPTFTPVDDDPFAAPAPQAAAGVPAPAAAQPLRFVPVDDDPFAAPAGGGSASAPGQPSALTIPVPVGVASAAGSVDPDANPNGDGLSQDQIDAAVRARFAKAGAQGRQNLVDLPENTAHAVAAAGGAVPVLGAGVNYAAAALASPFTSGSYGDNLAAANAMDAQFDAQHPYASGAAKAVGGTVGTIGLLPEAGLGAGAGSLLARMGTAAAAQGGLGAADAAVRGQNVAGGAVAGAATGALGPAAGAALGAGYRTLSGLMAPLPAELAGTGALDRKWLANALRGQSPSDLQSAADALGPAGMLGERSPGLLDLTQSVATNNGAGKAIVRDAFDARNAGTGQRVMGAVDDALGPAQNPTPVRQGIEDARSAVTAPYFAQAAQNGMPYTPELADLTQRPAVASAMRDAATDAANRGTPLGNITLDAAGNPAGSDAALQAYNAGTRPAVTDALARLMGTDANAAGPLAATDALTAQRSAASDPLYTAYRSMNVPMTPELADVLNRPSVQSAIPAAERKAQDQGRTIFAQRGAGFDRDPLGSGVTPEMPTDLPDIPPQAAEQAPSRPAPVGVPRPVDLHGFVRSMGGIQDRGGDLAAMGLDNLVARPGQGLGADAMRQAAAQMGYLNHTVDGTTDGAARFSTVNHLLDALGSDNPIHSVHDHDAVAAWAARDAAMQDYQQGGGAARGEVGRDAGMRPTPPGLPFGGPDAPTGPAARAPQLTPEGLDYLKRTLGDKIDTAQRAGNRDDARIYTGLQQQLLGAIERHPDSSIAEAYGAARQAYAGPSREIDALNSGRAAFADNVTPEQVQREYAALSTDGERQRYRDGMFAAGSEKLTKGNDTSNFVRTVSGNQALRDKFAAVVPHQEAIDVFNGHIARAQQQFTEATRPTPEAMHHALGVLDARVARGEADIAPARDALAAHMAADPYYARGRALDQEYGALGQAMTDGRTALRTGPNAIHPDDFADRFGGRTGAGQAAERVTMRDAVSSALRQNPNDLGTLSRTLQGDDGYNAAKIGTAFGQDAADALRGAVDREGLYRANKQAVMGGSPTGERQAVRGLTEPDMQNGIGGWWNNLYIDKPSTYLPSFLSPDALGERFLGSRYEAARERVAPQLVKTGPEADALVRAVMTSRAKQPALPPAQVDALTRALARTLAAGRQQAVSQ
ncbi:hypothetical protein D3273_22670 [Lichenibacterium minor]|uniref:Uncharacterized protein n=1 Tax=Lichenibacterium minor TaxID=2316528 RepID=A0A4Q2U082_9HYPH|nr:hypothetical protein [Lichenibacterium minor]RYC29682.1 hypothetical protein D3273_22670 [Lichenibacterium minor]